MTPDTPPAIATPAPDTALANQLLGAQLIDAAQTSWLLSLNGKSARCTNGAPACHYTTYEADPLMRPFVHSPVTAFGMAIGTNVLFRLLPHGVAKTLALHLALGVESANISKNWNLIWSMKP